MTSTNDYMVGPMIGQGSFAQVFYAVHKTSQRKAAIKVIPKITMRKHPWLVDAILTEKRILQQHQQHERQHPKSIHTKNVEDDSDTAAEASCRGTLYNPPHQWIVSLWAAFYDTQNFYLVMECCTGGDLEGLLCRVFQKVNNADGNHQTENQQRQEWLRYSFSKYATQLIDAVHYLHTVEHVLHCDLKPSNCLLDATSGHLKLSDFACAVQIQDNYESVPCIPRGTCEYASPEIIRGTSSHLLTVGVDYWSVGCIVHAMTHQGRSPFTRDSDMLIVQTIMDYCRSDNPETRMQSLDFDTDDSNGWKRLTAKLLQENPDKRVSAWKERHTFVATNWEDVEKGENKIILPTPEWKDSVESATLLDGNQGWTVFEQL